MVFSEIMAPENSPEWVHDRSKLWNSAEAAENRKDAQIAREVEVALPKELSREAQINLVRDYLKSEFVSKGMVADFSIHQPSASPANPHAHIMLSMRELTADG